jgi:hypothetical protein
VDLSDSITVQVCYSYPCVDVATAGDVLAWDKELIVVASVDTDAAVTVAAAAAATLTTTAPQAYTVKLVSRATQASVWSSGAQASRFASLLPSAVPVDASEAYDLRVEVSFAEAVASASSPAPASMVVLVARASLDNVTFAPPPVLHGIELVLDSASAAVSQYTARVNASSSAAGSSGEPLSYSFGLASFPHDVSSSSWAFDVAVDVVGGSVLSFAAPSTRVFALAVTVMDAHKSSTTCSLPSWSSSSSTTTSSPKEGQGNSSSSSSSDGATTPLTCPIGTGLSAGGAGQFDAAEVAAEVAALIQSGDVSADVKVAAFLAGLDAYTATASLLLLDSTNTSSGGSSDGSRGELNDVFEVLLQSLLVHVTSDSSSSSSSSSNSSDYDVQRFSSQAIVVLAAAVDAAALWSHDLKLGLGSGGDDDVSTLLLDIITAVGSELAGDPTLDDSTLLLYLEAVDTFAQASVRVDDDDSSSSVSASVEVVATIDALDAALSDACAASKAGSVPGGTETTFLLDTFSVTCSLFDNQASSAGEHQAVVVVATNDVASVVFGSGFGEDSATTTLSITTWDADATAALSGNNSTSSSSTSNGDPATTVLLSSIVGVHVSPGAAPHDDEDDDDDDDDEEDDDLFAGMPPVDDSLTYSISIVVQTDGVTNGEEMRKAVSCRYFDSDRALWSERGVFLRGLILSVREVDAVSAATEADTDDAPGSGEGGEGGGQGGGGGGEQATAAATTTTPMQLLANCVATHLTLFTLADDSAAVKVLEDKLSALGERVAAIGSVNLLDGDTHVNWPILAAFGFVTLLFLVAVVVSKMTGRQDAVQNAQRVFVQLGVLTRPTVRECLLFCARAHGDGC